MTTTIPLGASLGCNDIMRALAFPAGLAGGICLGLPTIGVIAVVRPFDGAAATVGNGAMIGFARSTHDAVRDRHRQAIEPSGTDEGEPGDRDGAPFACVRDPEGAMPRARHV